MSAGMEKGMDCALAEVDGTDEGSAGAGVVGAIGGWVAGEGD